MLESITIRINDVDYIVKKSYRSLLLFEQETGRGIDQIKETISDLLKLFWCILTANNRDTFKFSFDEFLDLLDDNQDSIDVFNTFLLNQVKEVSEKEPVVKKKKQ